MDHTPFERGEFKLFNDIKTLHGSYSQMHLLFTTNRLREGRNILQDIRSGEVQYFTGDRTESKFAEPKNLSGILTNKSTLSLVATYFALTNTIILPHAVSSLKLKRFVSQLLFWQKKYEMPLSYMHSTFPLSCTAQTLLFEQPVTNVFWPRIQIYQDCIVYDTIVSAYVRPKKNICLFPVTRPTVLKSCRPEFFSPNFEDLWLPISRNAKSVSVWCFITYSRYPVSMLYSLFGDLHL